MHSKTRHNRYAYLLDDGSIHAVNSTVVRKDPKYLDRVGAVKTWRIYADTPACTVLTNKVVFTELFKLDKFKDVSDQFKQQALAL